jgi:protein phosphatase
MVLLGRIPNRRLVSAHRSHVGRVRSSNEDVVVDDPSHGLYGVFDGMGGAQAGEVAARVAAATVRVVIQDQDRVQKVRDDHGDVGRLLHGAVTRASAAVFAAGSEVPAWRGMGTTAVVCLIRGADAHVAHVGDSRAYLARSGVLHALTKDHTMVQSLIDRGEIDPREAPSHPSRNALTRSLGTRPSVHPDQLVVGLQARDRLLLCSDGLTSYAEESAIARILIAARDPEDAAAALVDLALSGRGGDNVSVVVVEHSM